MKLETKRTLYLTKAEEKVLSDFYWSFYGNDTMDDMCDTLKALAEGVPTEYSPCEIKFRD